MSSTRPEDSAPATETLDPSPASPEASPRAADASPAGASDLGRGSALGRYVLLDRIGSGGMGTIFAAYDPDLDRRVAVKVLRAGAASPRRLLREARALARLQHPNVLTVFDVGSEDGRIFLATELLTGPTMTQWLTEGQRSWQEVLGVFQDVAEGLKAAHAEGLVHRDVKPSNLMITDDGRGLLVDFGIARETGDPEGTVVDLADLSPTGSIAGRQPPAAASDRAGTTGFMAPEQIAGVDIGPAADQYSFCVSLCWALSGELPDANRLSTLPGSVPADLSTILARGLNHRSAERWASMTELAEQLASLLRRHRRGRPWRRWTAAAVLTLGVAAWGLISSERTACSSHRERFAEVWSPARQAAIEAALVENEPAFGADVWRTISASLGAYGEAWADRGESWCRAERRDEISAVLSDLRDDCLEQRLREVEAALGLALTRSEPGTERLEQLFAGLTPLEVCDDGRALRSIAAPPGDAGDRSRLVDLRRSQAEVHALWSAGDLEDGLRRAEALVADARRLGWGPLEAEALYQRGLFEDALVDERARSTLVDAALTAAAARHDRVTAQSFVRLVRVAGLRPPAEKPDAASPGDVEDFAAKARRSLEGLGRPELLAADLLDYQGLAARQNGEYSAALDFHLQALELKTAELGPDAQGMADTFLRLGNLYHDLGDHGAAYDHLERALEVQSLRLGASHPSVANTHSRLGALARADGDLLRARDHHERALAIRQRVFGPERVPVAESLTYLGELQTLAGEVKPAEHSFDRALAILEHELGPDHPHVAITLATLASAQTEAGRDREALEPYGRALAIFETAYGSEHPQVGVLVFNLATVRLRLLELDTALRGFRSTATIWRGSLGSDHALVANALTGVADALERSGRADEALRQIDEVMALESAAGREAKWRADTDFVHARALRATGRDLGHVVRLAEQARELYLEDADASRRELAELEAWLADLPADS